MTSPHLETELTPVTLLTGFLGSGKTTVLNQLVRQPTLARTLVIINEFGEIGLDHLLMSRVADDNMIEMSSGCLCCTIRGDLVETLRDAHWRYQVGGEPRFDRVVIETTGLADPAPIIHTLMSVGAIARRYRLDGVVTTIDLTSAEATLDAQPEAVKQAAIADCLLLTKRDLVTDPGGHSRAMSHAPSSRRPWRRFLPLGPTRAPPLDVFQPGVWFGH